MTQIQKDIVYIEVVVALISTPLNSEVCPIRAADVFCPHENPWSSAKAYFIAERPDGPHSGLWEFPGGKVDPGETYYQALCREVHEEVGVVVESARPMVVIDVPSDKDQNVICRLHVWDVLKFRGKPYGAEGQATQWRQLLWQDQALFLPPNRHMFTALRLGCCMALINMTDFASFQSLLERIQELEHSCNSFKDSLVVRLRAAGMAPDAYYSMVLQLQQSLTKTRLQFCLDVLPHDDFFTENYWQHPWNVSAYFPSWWQSSELANALQKALAYLALHSPNVLKGASCHSSLELEWACQEITGPQAHYYVLSPVLPTQTHPEMQELGWAHWSMINNSQPQLGFALGGLSIDHLTNVRAAGGFGLAGLSAFATNDLTQKWAQAEQAQLQEALDLKPVIRPLGEIE